MTAPVSLTASGLLAPTPDGLALVDPQTGLLVAERSLEAPAMHAIVSGGVLYAVGHNSMIAIR